MDFYSTEDMYDSFRRYQTAMLERFDQLAEEFQFNVIDAKPEPAVIFEQLREGILKVLVSREPAEAKPSEAKPAEAKPAEVKPAEVKPAAKTAPSAAASAANPPAAVPAEAPPGDVVAVSVPEAGGAAEERRNQIAKAR